jgi:paraquat-inducible protein B
MGDVLVWLIPIAAGIIGYLLFLKQPWRNRG